MNETGERPAIEHTRKTTVEETWTVSVSDLLAGHDGCRTSGTVSALRVSDHSILRVRFLIQSVTGPSAGALVYLFYAPRALSSRPELVRLRLGATKPHFGSERLWFSCPGKGAGDRCGRRAGKLHLPPGEAHFACRRCHSLTYTSSRRSHRYDRLCTLATGEGPSGANHRALKRALNHNELSDHASFIGELWSPRLPYRRRPCNLSLHRSSTLAQR